MGLLGALVGIIFGAISGLVLAFALFSGIPVPGFLTPIAGIASAIGSGLSGLPWPLAFLTWYIANVLVFWLLCIPVQASTGLTSTAVPLPPSPIAPTALQLFYRGFGYGTAATINIGILVPFLAIPPALIIATISLLPILALIPAVRLNLFFQGLIGWMNWVQPVHWFGNLIGFVIYVVFRFTGAGVGLRLDLTSGVIESRAPGAITAFNVGTFTFLGPAFPPGPFLGANVSSHEVGHAMNSAAMTPFYTWGTVIEEFRLFSGPVEHSIGQQTAESRGLPRTGVAFAALW